MFILIFGGELYDFFVEIIWCSILNDEIMFGFGDCNLVMEDSLINIVVVLIMVRLLVCVCWQIS